MKVFSKAAMISIIAIVISLYDVLMNVNNSSTDDITAGTRGASLREPFMVVTPPAGARSNAVEKVAPQPESSSKVVKPQLESSSKEATTQWTIVITVNDGFFDFMSNWLLFYEKLALKNRLVVIAEDDLVYTKLEALGLPEEKMEIEKASVLQNVKEALGYETAEYKKMVSGRPTHLLNHLRQGTNILYTDIDTVWRSNPIAYLALPENDEYDFIIQIDTDSYYGVSPYYCTGFMGLRSNSRTISFMEKWEAALQKHPQLNQPIFNQLLHGQKEVKHTGLPKDLFPSGKSYFDSPGFTQKKRDNAVVVHNNYVMGHHVKKERFKKFGLWLL
jgi:hypothetical protein